MREIAPANQAEVETRIYTMTQNHPLPSCRIQLMRLFMQNAISEPMVKKLYILWQQQSDKHLNRQDYTTLAYELAIRMPLESEQILRTQRARIDDPDRLRQFDFISRAAVSDTARLDTLFNSLLAAENRRIEPWTTAVIRYLNHPLREDQSVKYIRPGLEVLEEVQRTGDYFNCLPGTTDRLPAVSCSSKAVNNRDARSGSVPLLRKPMNRDDCPAKLPPNFWERKYLRCVVPLPAPPVPDECTSPTDPHETDGSGIE